MDVGRYLHRIGFAGEVRRDEETLHGLVQAHLHTVPFENLDIHLGVPITLDERAMYRKIVENRRGGFCYEVNGLLAVLLREIGFEVDYLSGQASLHGGFYPPFSHLALRVTVGGRPYLVDVGYGECIRAPMPLEVGAEQQAFGSTFTLREHGRGLRMVARDEQGHTRGYLLDLEPRQLPQFGQMCHFLQTSIESMFTRRRLCTLPTAAGRLTMVETRLIRSEHGTRSEREIPDEAAYLATLRTCFGIELPYMPRNKSDSLTGRLSKQAMMWQTRARRAWRRLTEPPLQVMN